MAEEGGSPGGLDRGSRRLTWTAYLFMACQGYLIYAVAFITPYLQAELGAAPWMAALPNTAVAVGFLAGGAAARPIMGRLGGPLTIRLWAILMAASALLLAIPVSIAPILAGAFLFGTTAAGLLVHVNSALAGRRSGMLLVRANLWAVLGGVAGPLALSAAARSVGWSLGVLLPIPLLVALAFVLPGSPARDVRADDRREPPLGRPYWLAWTYLALCIGAEFSFVAWGAPVVAAQAGLAVADATALASLYVVGMVLGRLALGSPLGAGLGTALVLRASTVLAVVGAALVWVADAPAPAGLGLFLGGLGIAAIYPFAAQLALSHAPNAPVRASARLTAASAVAIMTAPLLLGLVAGATGVIGAWALVLGLLAAALAVLVAVPRPGGAAPAPVAVDVV